MYHYEFKINKLLAVSVSQHVVIMNLRVSTAVLVLSLLASSKHYSDAKSKVSSPFPCESFPQLIPAVARCDGYPDCPGGEDEHGCPPPHEEIQLTRRHQAGHLGNHGRQQQSGASMEWSFNHQEGFRNTVTNQNSAFLKHFLPSHQQSKRKISTFQKAAFYEKGSDAFTRQQSLGQKPIHKKGLIQNANFNKDNNEKINYRRNQQFSNNHHKNASFQKNSVTNGSWRMMAAGKMIPIKARNPQGQNAFYSNYTRNSPEQNYVNGIKFSNNNRERGVNNYSNIIKIPTQEATQYVSPDSAAISEVHHGNGQYGQGLYRGHQQTKAQGKAITSKVDYRAAQFTNKFQATGHHRLYQMGVESHKYRSKDSHSYANEEHVDRPRDEFQKPSAFKRGDDLSWTKDRWTISILVILTCISLFSMIVQCWYCK